MWIEELTDALTALHRCNRGYVIAELATTPYYVQLLRDEHRIGHPRALLEAVSNEYLLGAAALNEDQEAALQKLGWQAPHSACDPVERCGVDHPNWFCFVDIDASSSGQGALMGLVLATLGVFGSAEGADVRVTVDCSTEPATA